MHAFQPSRHLQPVESPRKVSPTRSKPSRSISRQPKYRARAIETGAKLSVNVILTIAAGTALVKLLPYGFAQQTKLQEIHAEVSIVKERVDRLQTDFSRNFDPQQSKAIMQEQSSRIDPQQRQVIFVQPQPASTTAP
ncbi:hypothetical protein H6F67_06040 [Microcoleus sp. FACHB-1515]|uniref:slr1601 family putative cell division protein n=1 Tax=Cyanophyceae TaxID=3028117 RepID=UPI0016865A42|nr:hypothetical protein [Microcoleus sp. FACHB-1515]MBD2089410.1 hypothetical protein [Microcoleus sp. FACHB-1515]